MHMNIRLYGKVGDGKCTQYSHLSPGWPAGELTRTCGLTVGEAVGAAVGDSVGETVGEAVGATVGAAVGNTVSAAVGAAKGGSVGEAVGADVGDSVGETVGEAVGATLSAAVGNTVGAAVGAAVGGDEQLVGSWTLPIPPRLSVMLRSNEQPSAPKIDTPPKAKPASDNSPTCNAPCTIVPELERRCRLPASAVMDKLVEAAVSFGHASGFPSSERGHITNSAETGFAPSVSSGSDALFDDDEEPGEVVESERRHSVLSGSVVKELFVVECDEGTKSRRFVRLPSRRLATSAASEDSWVCADMSLACISGIRLSWASADSSLASTPGIKLNLAFTDVSSACIFGIKVS